ncbi:MAG TPA: hypothetical protein VHT51_04160, partial [Micropepsaceae bacterium]|nr:hypothetical protein [Micropepsaceae bacterium]
NAAQWAHETEMANAMTLTPTHYAGNFFAGVFSVQGRIERPNTSAAFKLHRLRTRSSQTQTQSQKWPTKPPSTRTYVQCCTNDCIRGLR